MDFLKYLFRNTAECSDFNIFGLAHITILFIGILGIVFILKRMNVSRKFERILGIVLLAQQIILYTWYLRSGYKLLTEGLPLYHCRIAIILIGIGLFFNKSICKKIGSIWGLIGAVSALVYPVLDPFVFPHITQISFFIGHLFLLWSSVYCIFVECIKLSKKDLKIIIYFTNIYHISMFIFNHIIGSNYGYMRVSPIGIGNDLHPVVYGLIIIAIFNALIVFMNLLMNTLKLSVFGLLWGFPIPIILAILISRVKSERLRKNIQLIIYAPNFISVIVISGMIIIFLSPVGPINQLFGTTINFMAKPEAFRTIYIASGIWQGAGWASIIYTAALSNASKELTEAAIIDGANVFQQIWNVDIPAIKPIMVIQFILSAGNIMSIGFEKALALQNNLNLPASEILPTYVYKMGLQMGDYSFSTAVGLFNAVINVILLIIVNTTANKLSKDDEEVQGL